MKKTVVISLFLILSQLVFSQKIKGVVLDDKTNQLLESVSIYFDGTTIGATTNGKGEFNIVLNSKLKINAILVISFLGYETLLIQRKDLENNKTYRLVEKEEFLDEVVIYDDWSRQKKLKAFKRQFLGFDKNSADCKIKNLDQLNLVYNKNEHKLYASSNQPLIIENKALGYILKYDLVDFQLQYVKCNDCITRVQSVFYSGTSQFKEVNEKTKRKHKKAREKAFYGSLVHFMRTLTKDKLKEEKFSLIKQQTVNKKKTYSVIDTDDAFVLQKDTLGYKAYLKLKEKLTVKYNNFEQSVLLIEDANRFFFIDDYGNHAPVYKIIFGGRFGKSRISTMLPKNYFPE